MVYVSHDGNILESAPWNLKRVFGIFTGFFYMIIMLTLISPDMNKYGSDYTRDYRPGSGPPRPPTRRMGRPNTRDNIDIPFGGCKSCAR